MRRLTGKQDRLNVSSMSPRKNTKAVPAIAVKRARLQLGLTKVQFAGLAQCSPRQVARWEAGQGAIHELVLQYILDLRSPVLAPEPSAFTFIDLFAGIGGFHLGFKSAKGRCLFTSEWNRWAQITYRENFPGHDIHGDITQVAARDVPDHDVLLAGFPCQPFSIAGVSKKNALGRKHGFDCDTQGTLFFDIERIIKTKQPKAFVLENVKNLASHDGGRTIAVIMDTLQRKLKYRVSRRIIDARSVVPQHRERVFIVGIHPDLDTTFDWDEVTLPEAANGPVLGSILHSAKRRRFEPQSDARSFRYPEDPAFTESTGRALAKYTLSDHLWEYLKGYALKHQAKGNGFGFGLVGPRDVARTLSARYYKDGSEILIAQRGRNPRRLTPRECARLMGFDRPGRPLFKIPVSDTQAYKQFGNAVVVPVVEAIAKALVPYVKGERKGNLPPEVSALTAA